eukprot:365643-Chlamydomonas_euryale.AAC.28
MARIVCPCCSQERACCAIFPPALCPPAPFPSAPCPPAPFPPAPVPPALFPPAPLVPRDSTVHTPLENQHMARYGGLS